ncbi:MAG: alpha/beta hydrolase [Methanomicrobiales archaeon]|nr:alpha/beta hydrolase [Methanomicrobiales archaeon]
MINYPWINHHSIQVCLIIVSFIITTGCTIPDQRDTAPQWNLSPDGNISFTVPKILVQEQVIVQNENLRITNLTFKGFFGDVHALQISPKIPVAFLVWAPGANNPAAGYLEYMKYYPEHNIGVLIIDVRGNGGITPGYPMDIERDAELFLQGEWPQLYLIAIDLISAEQYVMDHYPSVPVYAVGDSNGGRYAALAAGSENSFAGYIGISMSGFNCMGDQYKSPLREFLLSIDPEFLIPRINTRPVLLFHAPGDPIIPFEDGHALADAAGNNSKFIPFNGTHGVNREVDDKIIAFLHGSYTGVEG